MNRLLQAAAAILSAILFWFGMGLHPMWWLTWLAPIPVLLASTRSGAISAVVMAFTALIAGALDEWTYMHRLLGIPTGVVLEAIAMPAAAFAAAVVVWQRLYRRQALIRAAMGFAVVWVCYEFLVQQQSPHSTFGDLAYSQMDFLPVIQVASLAGISGIDFLLFLFSAAISILLLAQTRRVRLQAAALLLVPLSAAGWGMWRLHSTPEALTLTAGLVSSDLPQNLYPRIPERQQVLFREYADQAQQLIAKGARLIIIPEKIARIDDAMAQTVDVIFGGAAKRGAVVVAGLERWTATQKLNESRIYGPDGSLIATYEKHHMLPAFEGYLLPGKTLTLLTEPSGIWGATICKDMDFPHLSRDYGRRGVGLLIVPAWDFNADGWLHGRMAVLRGVESGFSIARAAKQGTLTVTDDRGRILAERATGVAPFATLLASVPVRHDITLYDRWGDWFAWLSLGVLIVILGSMFVRTAKVNVEKLGPSRQAVPAGTR